MMGPVQYIGTVVAGHYGVRPAMLLRSDRRSRMFSHPRQVAMYLARDLTTLSMPMIGREFGKDHTTVMHACRAVEARLEHDEKLRRDVLDLKRRLYRELDGSAKRSADEALLEEDTLRLLEGRVTSLFVRLRAYLRQDPCGALLKLEHMQDQIDREAGQ